MKRNGFDNDKYVRMQSEKIRERIAQFGDKLYLEFGGKLFDDFHAARVLPGFLPDSKINMLQTLRDDAEIVLAIHAGDIERNKVRDDLDIAYDAEVLRLIDAFRAKGLLVTGVVITRYGGQAAADAFAERLTRLGVRDAVKRGEATLLALEEKVGFAARYRAMAGALERIESLARDIRFRNAESYSPSAAVGRDAEELIALCAGLSET